MNFRYKQPIINITEPVKYNVITLGYDCSTAQALRDMGLRKQALPFDWTISSIDSLEKCFKDRFSMFHKKLNYNHNKTRLIDHYGFEFPHDYPVLKDVLDCSFNSVVKEHTIVDNWIDYNSEVLYKYERRIKRFLYIMQDPNHLIILCRHDIKDLPKLKSLFKKYYNKENVFFVDSTPQKQNILRPTFDPNIFQYTTLCNTEENGQWNETTVWKTALNECLKQFIQK
jgi:hypothetical protein